MNATGISSASIVSKKQRGTFALIVIVSLWPVTSRAQFTTAITPSGYLGTAVSQAGNTFNISGGTTKGSNLFHSFGLFSLGSGDVASFNGPNNIANIFSRVTGRDQSRIDGTIRSTIPGANLFLMNPAGVLFGPNARLDVTGSFHVSTADYLKFTDGAKFYVDLAQKSDLTSAPISAFGFLSQNPAGISIQGSALWVPEGKTLSLVGGDINIQGDPFRTFSGMPTVYAPAGQINLASVASVGEVPVNVQDLNVSSFARLGEINLTSAAFVDTSGNGGGTVVIRGGHLLVNNSFIYSINAGDIDGLGAGVDIHIAGDAEVVNGSLITADGFGPGRPKDIQVTADTVHIDNSQIGGFPDLSSNTGSIRVGVKNLTLTNGALIRSDTSGSGSGGTVQVTANETISLDRSSITARNEAGSTGNAGDITIEATNVTLTGGAQIATSSYGFGDGGAVRISATDTLTVTGTNSAVSDISANTSGQGNAGNLLVEARNVTLTEGGQIASGTFGEGKAGTVNVKAIDSVTLSGTNTPFASSISAQANPGSTGGAGDLIIEAKNVTGIGKAFFSNSTFESGKGGNLTVKASDTVAFEGIGATENAPNGIFARSLGNDGGDAGNIVVEAKNLLLSNGASVHSDTFGVGNGGTVRVKAADTVRLDGAGSEVVVIAAPGSRGNAGNVLIDAKNVLLTGGAQIRSDTFGSGNGGTVQIDASNSIILDGASPFPSGIFADAAVGNGNAGNIVLKAKDVTLSTGAVIRSQAFSSGHGGSVRVTVTDMISLDGANTEIATTAGFGPGSGRTGNAGEIVLEAKDVMMSGGALIDSSAYASGNGGTVRITATDKLSLDGGNTKITATAQPGSTGNAGDIAIEAKNVTLTGGAGIVGETSGSGKGGTISLTANDTVSLDGSFISASAKESTGNAGDIVIQAKDVTLLNGALVSSETFGSGTGGTVSVTAANAVSVAGSIIATRSQGGSNGNAGDIMIEANSVTLTDDGGIASDTLGPGNGGIVHIKGRDTINLDNSSITATSNPTNLEMAGKAGDILIETKNLTMNRNAVIATNTYGSGSGGTVQVISSDSINLEGSSITATAGGRGNAGNIIVNANGTVSLSGSLSGLSALAFSDGNAGDVVVVANNVVVTDGALVRSDTFGSGNAGHVTVQVADSLNLAGTSSENFSSGIFTSANASDSAANAGNIVIEAKNVALTDGAEISSATFGSGKGGNVRIKAETVSLAHSGIFAETSGRGAAGNVTVEAKNVFLTDGGIFVSTFGTGTAGDILIQGLTPNSRANNVILTDAGVIDSSTFGSSGNGGNVTVKAETLRVAGRNSDDGPSGIFASAEPERSSANIGSGNAGSILVEAKNVVVTDGARVFSGTVGSGNGGTVQITASENVTLDGNSTISSSSSGSGKAGDVLIQAKEFRSVNGSVTTESATAGGGNIQFNVTSLVHLTNSQIITSVHGGDSSAGNITIDPQAVVLNHSQIRADAFGGAGGNVKIVADVFLASPDSVVSASSTKGIQGTVDIQSPITNLTGSLAPLPENVLQATSLLRQSCAARFSERRLSSLVVGSRDGLPLEPGGLLLSRISRMAGEERNQKSAVREQKSEVGGQKSDLERTEPNSNRRTVTDAVSKSDLDSLLAKSGLAMNWPCTK